MKNLRFSSRRRANVRPQGPPGSARAQRWTQQQNQTTKLNTSFCFRPGYMYRSSNATFSVVSELKPEGGKFLQNLIVLESSEIY